jgi:hypothetical protein
MTLIFPDGFRIETTTEITYNQYNSIFNALKGEWSYPFQLVGTPEILAYFNYPHLPNIGTVLKKVYENVSFYEGSFLIGSGTFTILDANAKIIVANLNTTAGNIPLKTLNQKLNTFDLGMDNLNTSLTKSGLYACLFSKFDVNNTNRLSDFWRRCTLVLKVDNVQIWDYSFYISQSAYHESGTDDVADRLDDNLAIINQSWADIQQPYELILSKDCINLIIKDNSVAHNVQLTIRTLPSGDRDRTPAVSRTYQFDRIEYNSINNALDDSLTNTWSKPYVFPTIIDAKFYDDAVKSAFYGLINNINLNHIETNDYLNRTKNVICPQFYLIRILRLIFQKLNYQPTGTFFENNELQKILVLSLYALDKQASLTTLAFNVHAETIKYANHLPNISLLDFLKALIDQFGIGIDFNPLTKVVNFFFFKDILKNNPTIIDISDRVAILPKNKFEEKRPTQTKYSISGDSLAKEETSPYISVPTKAIVEASADTYEPLELKFAPLTTNPQGKIQIEAQGISPLYNQLNNESPLRFFFYEAPEGKAETNTFSLDLTKQNSNYVQFIKPKLDFEAKTQLLECTTLLTLTEIISLTQTTLFLAYHVYWYWDSLSTPLKSGKNIYEVTLKLRRVEK